MGGEGRAAIPAQAGVLAGQRRLAKRSAGPTNQQSQQTKRSTGRSRTGSRGRRWMVTPPPKKPTEVAKSQTAVTKLPPPWPTQEKVKDLASLLDRHYRHLEAMMKMDERLDN